MERRRVLMGMQSGFNYLDPNTWYVASSATERHKGRWGKNIVNNSGKQVILIRIVVEAGLAFRMGQLTGGKTYTLSGIYTNSDGKAYIGRITTDNGDNYICTRDFTLTMANGTVSFTPQYTAEYDFLLWKRGTNPIIAENVALRVN